MTSSHHGSAQSCTKTSDGYSASGATGKRQTVGRDICASSQLDDGEPARGVELFPSFGSALAARQAGRNSLKFCPHSGGGKLRPHLIARTYRRVHLKDGVVGVVVQSPVDPEDV